MSVTTKLFTAEDLAAMGDDSHFELIRGELREQVATKLRHGKVSGRFHSYLGMYSITVLPGEVIHGETGFHLEDDPDSVLMPDLSFIRRERMPPDAELDSFARVVPDAALEVLSPSNTRRVIETKLAIYLTAGVRLVWIADPVAKTIEAYTPAGFHRVYRVGDDLDGGDVLPGFRVPVAAFFD
jgi:Uma2 family endonuclease